MIEPLYSTRMAIGVSVVLGSVVPICLKLHYDSFWGVFCFCAAIANLVIWKMMKHHRRRGPGSSETVSIREPLKNAEL